MPASIRCPKGDEFQNEKFKRNRTSLTIYGELRYCGRSRKSSCRHGRCAPFSLAGGVVYFLLYQVGYIAAISGLIGVICAFKGYEVFAKKLSKFGCIISVVMALLVIILAWYCCLAKDVYSAYQSWFADGEIDFTLTFAESLRNAYRFLSEPEISKSYVTDLIIGIFLCALGAVRPIINIVKGNKNKAAEDKNEPAFQAEKYNAPEEKSNAYMPQSMRAASSEKPQDKNGDM